MKWFEKTVEYRFVRDFDSLMACPLDGKLELTGDTIFGKGEEFFLVEFKRNSDARAECDKYKSWKTAHDNLSADPMSKCHFVVYGMQEAEQFSLGYANYCDFLRQDTSKFSNIINDRVFKENVVLVDAFKNYLEKVIIEKLRDKDSNSEGVALSVLEALDNVYIVNPKKAMLSIREAADELNLTKVLDLTKKIKQKSISRPSFSR